jgi:LmbE family N-acetylglucosaminyl deacetylase
MNEPGASRLRGLARWLGLPDAAVRLEGEVVVVSPHLDDAVLSLGGAISHASRTGARVRVLTVFAGDPASEAAAGPWDERPGFRTAGEAARARREDDRRACAILGAEPVWLPYPDHQYERNLEPAAIRAEIVELVGDAAIYVPGFPLGHEDHAWLTQLLEDAFEPRQVGFYVEQPYFLWTSETSTASPGGNRWERAAADAYDRVRKLRACRAYGSQLAFLGSGLMRGISRREARIGGELVSRPRDGRR